MHSAEVVRAEYANACFRHDADIACNIANAIPSEGGGKIVDLLKRGIEPVAPHRVNLQRVDDFVEQPRLNQVHIPEANDNGANGNEENQDTLGFRFSPADKLAHQKHADQANQRDAFEAQKEEQPR